MNTKCFKEVISLCVLFTVTLTTAPANADEITITHGIASGDVTPLSAVLWTRANQEATLQLEVATDSDFEQIIFDRSVQTAGDDFTAKVFAAPLIPNRTHFYRWRSGDHSSETGTFQTPPLRLRPVDVRFAFSGDSDGTTRASDGFRFNNFEALGAAQRERLDFFIYLGDTIYADSQLRESSAKTLEEYRGAYKVNREYENLLALLKSTSVYAIWDDHEVRNDYAGQTVDPERYANGRRAFLEYMPVIDLKLPADPGCAGSPLFRYFRWGKDVDIIILDERTCRNDKVESACLIDTVLGPLPDFFPTLPTDVRRELRREFPLVALLELIPLAAPPGCLAAIFDPTRTMLGPTQKALLKSILAGSRAKFKFIINEVPIQQLFVDPYDRWEGYGAERAELINFVRRNQVKNVIFLTTDLHANIINEVFIDAFTNSQPVAHEFVTSPIATFTLAGPREGIPPELTELLADVVNFLLDRAGVDCRNLDSFAYGLVEVDVHAETTTVTLKDDDGNLLFDDLQPSVGCKKTVSGR